MPLRKPFIVHELLKTRRDPVVYENTVIRLFFFEEYDVHTVEFSCQSCDVGFFVGSFSAYFGNVLDGSVAYDVAFVVFMHEDISAEICVISVDGVCFIVEGDFSIAVVEAVNQIFPVSGQIEVAFGFFADEAFVPFSDVFIVAAGQLKAQNLVQ